MLLDRLSPEGGVGRRQHPHPAHTDLCWMALLLSASFAYTSGWP